MTISAEGDVQHVMIVNQAGSVEHFYHFLLGFLLPLANFVDTLRGTAAETTLLVRSCGPMDRMLGEVGLPGVVAIPKDVHADLEAAAEWQGRPLRKAVLFGLDFSQGGYPPAAIFRHAVSLLKKRLAPAIEAHGRRYDEVFAPGARRILLINRSSDPYYLTPQAENAGSGAERRSIGNFEAMHRAVQSAFGNSLAIVLEQASLAEQVALFSTADVVIAQHGAALANVIWCKPGTRILEIAPVGYRVKCFPQLSETMGLDHRLIPQQGLHGDCDLAELLKGVGAATPAAP